MGRSLAATLLACLLAPALAAAAPDAGAPKTPDAGVPAAPAPPSDFPADRMPAVKVKAVPDEVKVGGLVSLEITVRRRAEDRVHLPAEASFDGLFVQGKDQRASEPKDGWVNETLVIRLVPFEPREYVIPAQALSVVDPNGHVGEVATNEVRVRVKSLIANEPEPKLKEDKGPGVKVLEKDYTALYVLAALAAAGLVVVLTLLGRWLWGRYRPRPVPPPPPPRPAEEIALEKLGSLGKSDLLERGLFKEFHVLLSEAMREYLGNRYRFDSLELSTEELVLALRKVSLASPLFNTLLDFLSDTDLVKFAKLEPTTDESRRLLAGAFHVVEVTTPRAEAAPVPSSLPPEPAKGDPSGGAHA
ncbi:MAG: hypothetical protein PHU25_11445 [Deltaproteobacteria bacterium]|nr:hypothetical protein [Deltaproteobacteria bacterium]